MKKRLWLWGIVLVCVVVGAMAGFAAARMRRPAPTVVESGMRRGTISASAFHLVAPDGTVRAWLGFSSGARPQPALVLCNEKGIGTVVLGMTSDGSSMISLLDGKSQVRLALEAMSNGAASLHLSDREGQKRVILAVTPGGTSGLTIRDAVASERAALVGMSDTGLPMIALTDRTGNPLFFAP